MSHVYIDPGLVYFLSHVRQIGTEEVGSVVRGIEEYGDDFPPIEVGEFADMPGRFLLYEGHRRAVGHFMAGRTVKAVILNRKEEFDPSRASVGQIELVDNPERYRNVKALDPNYR